MLNRNTPPDYFPIVVPRPIFPKKHNHFPFFFRAHRLGFVQLEIILNAGKKYELLPGTSFFTARLIQKGTRGKTAIDIARFIDAYGAYVQIFSQYDFVKIKLLTLEQHYHAIFQLIQSFLQYPTFDENEFLILKKRAKHQCIIDQEKNDYVAKKKMFSILWGKNHPLGKHLDEKNIDALSLKDIKRFYYQYFHHLQSIFFCGKIDDFSWKKTQNYLHSFQIKSYKTAPFFFSKNQKSSKKIYIEKKSLQTAICIGKILVPKQHVDYPMLWITNELLGGYFGSKLNQILREKKGYTYGIFSQIIPLVETSIFLINTDVLKSIRKKAIQAIYQVIEDLQQTMISSQALHQLKNHLQGQLLSIFDGPLATMDLFAQTQFYHLKKNYYQQLYYKICAVQAQDIMHIAQKYFQIDSLQEVSVG